MVHKGNAGDPIVRSEVARPIKESLNDAVVGQLTANIAAIFSLTQ